MIKKFKFLNPGKAKPFTDRLNENKGEIDTSGLKWHWRDGGNTFSINWENFNFLDKDLIEVLKFYIFFRLENYSGRTVASDVRMIKNLAEHLGNARIDINSIEDFLSNNLLNTGDEYHSTYYCFKAFSKFCNRKSLLGFEKKELKLIQEYKPEKLNPYSKVFLRQNVLTSNDELSLINHLDKSYTNRDYVLCRNNVLLNICFELGPRAIQIYCIEVSDFNIIKGAESTFYSINLTLVKKIKTGGNPEKRVRSISKELGRKIEEYLEIRQKILKSKKNLTSLFLNTNETRLSTTQITRIVSLELRKIGLAKGDSLTVLRHHLAQSLADQGAPAETIAELLGHNSTVASRAYIAASPEISEIKTKALGKNFSYLNIMKMFITGEIIDRREIPKERWVKGLVGGQYIGGIGSCGLSTATACPKNPVYSCYTCSKFHPFIDGSHQEVVSALERQSQYFVDIAEKGLLIESNRPVVQLESTIEAVKAVIQKCEIEVNKNDEKKV